VIALGFLFHFNIVFTKTMIEMNKNFFETNKTPLVVALIAIKIHQRRLEASGPDDRSGRE